MCCPHLIQFVERWNSSTESPAPFKSPLTPGETTVLSLRKIAPYRASIISLSGRPVRLGPRSNISTKTGSHRLGPFPIDALPELAKHSRPSRSCLATALTLMFLVGLAGCGPASSDHAPGLETRASVDGASLSKQGLSPGNNSLTPITQAAGSVPIASGNATGVAPDKLPVPGIPESIAKDLDSPDARLRIQALNHWDTKGTKAPLDPVFEALEDENEAVRAKATAIIEQRWAAEQEKERR